MDYVLRLAELDLPINPKGAEESELAAYHKCAVVDMSAFTYAGSKPRTVKAPLLGEYRKFRKYSAICATEWQVNSLRQGAKRLSAKRARPSQRGETMNHFPRTNPPATALVMLCLGLSQSVFANPEVTKIEGVLEHGTEMTIHGMGFSTKAPAQPLFWAPMEVSAEPSSLGLVTSWSGINNMSFAEDEGPSGGALMAINDSGNWTAQVNATGDFSWAAPGQTMYLYRKLKQNFSYLNPDGTEKINWKTWRLWGEILETGIRVSLLVGASNSTFSVSGYSLESGQSLWPFNRECVQGPINEWKTDELLLRSNTNSTGYGDGFVENIVNGRSCGQVPYESWSGTRHLKLWDAATTPILQRNFVVHGVKANYTMDPQDRYWASSVYLDTTWARVMIGDAPSLHQATHVEIQIPTAWAPNAVSVKLNTRAFPANKSAYLFVVDAENNVSPGFPLTPTTPMPPDDVRAE